MTSSNFCKRHASCGIIFLQNFAWFKFKTVSSKICAKFLASNCDYSWIVMHLSLQADVSLIEHSDKLSSLMAIFRRSLNELSVSLSGIFSTVNIWVFFGVWDGMILTLRRSISMHSLHRIGFWLSDRRFALWVYLTARGCFTARCGCAFPFMKASLMWILLCLSLTWLGEVGTSWYSEFLDLVVIMSLGYPFSCL